MNNARDTSLKRLKKVLLNDKSLPSGLLNVLRSDLDIVLASYFEYDNTKLVVDINLDTSGAYNLVISAPIDRVKNIKVI